jgi:hypothetical protein
MFFVPCIRARFSVVLMCILIVCVSSYQKLRFPLCKPILHIEGPCACLCFWPGDMDKGSTLDLKLARSLREVCADFGWKIIFLAGLLLILRGLEHRTCMRLTVRETKIRCRNATQAYKSMLKKQYDIPLYNFPCAKPWAARDLRDAGFKLSRSSQQTRLLNFKTVLEQPPHGLSYQN